MQVIEHAGQPSKDSLRLISCHSMLDVVAVPTGVRIWFRLPLSCGICMKATPYRHGPLTPYPSQTDGDQAAFLNDAFERCARFNNMYEKTKQANGKEIGK